MAVAPRTSALLAAVKSSDVDALKRAIARGGDPNARDPGGWTPLGFAIVRGDAESVRVLVDAGADIELSIDVDGPVQTPLRFAEEFWAKKEIGAFLRSRGALPWAPRPPSPPAVRRVRQVRRLPVASRWLRLDREPEPASPRWEHVLGGLILAVLALPGLVASLTMLLRPRGNASAWATVVALWILMLMSVWLFAIGGRLVCGRRASGGLMSPRLLRAWAWVFLLVPVGGVFTGWFAGNLFLAGTQSVACASVFFALQSLAGGREARARMAESSPDAATSKTRSRSASKRLRMPGS